MSNPLVDRTHANAETKSDSGQADTLRLVLLGDSAVGKSSLLLRFASPEEYTDSFVPTFGVDMRLRTVQLKGKTVRLQIWDTAGQERFRAIAPAYYRNAHGVILVYDITDARSFDHIAEWMADVERYSDKDSPPKVMLVGNKADLESARQVAEKDAQVFSDEHHLTFIETSARTSTNVEAAFMLLTQEILQGNHKPLPEPLKPRNSVFDVCCR